jgi:RimJ/RimL family protein N-acetyltransferase
MLIRPIRADELDLFVEAGGAPEHRREVKGYVQDIFAAASMRPGWCFVLENGDRALGRVALWTEEVGEEAFVDAVRRVSEGTLDHDIREESERRGPQKAAREFFEEEQDLEYDPGWWELAYGPEGELVGLVMPARNPTSPVIGYIGVVPEHRGKRYVDDLLARGAATLLSAGAERIRADTDTANAPMAEAFRRAGYVEFARRREYRVDLTR